MPSQQNKLRASARRGLSGPLVLLQGPQEIVVRRKLKFTKSEAEYGPSTDPYKHRCGMCEYHLHVPGTDKMECAIVEGEIKDTDGCKFFDADLIAAANPCSSTK
jgi:hypothetical protein